MENILFVNACVRPESRTLALARAVLAKLDGRVTEVALEKENIQPLNGGTLEKREALIAVRDYSDEMFRYAKDFAAADTIVLAAPYWDLSFPATVRIYLEAVAVKGLVFAYSPEGVPYGLGRAKRLIYVTTAGGPIFANMGYDYVSTLAKSLFGIPETRCFKAEDLDVWGADVESILAEAKAKIEKEMV